MKCGTYIVYVSDRVEAATGSKMCCPIFVLNLAPSSLQRYHWYFADTYLGLSRSAASAIFGPNCSRFCEMVAILNWKNHIFALFSASIWLFQQSLVGTLLGVRDTLSVNLTSNDLNCTWEMAANFNVWNCILNLPFFQPCSGYSNETWYQIRRQGAPYT